ncbi:zinc finger protein 37 homolog [Danio aesculapii]|uniref:zinc finger protein 37 homolog n=1 Tax=Danio aesculapii TaxID=1142201 RepID=UPI0024BF79E7|nr:zinc finger protein 37 homolog [Danio aesculapii]
MNTADFQTHLTAIIEIMVRTAAAEISKLFEENSLLLRMEILRCTNENESLKKKCNFLENELESARKTAGEMNGTQAPLSVTETGQPPTIDNVFGKEWCMNLWRQEESGFGEPEDAQKPIDLLDGEPDMIMIKDETKNASCCLNGRPEDNKSSSLTGPAMSNDERCADQKSDDYITYTVPSDEQAQSHVQQPQPEEQSLHRTIHAHGHITTDVNFNHMKVEAQMMKYKCVFCDRPFKYISHLQRHMRKHSGEKPYVCAICGRRFAQKTYLTTHERTHSGERPYACIDCGKSFSQKSSLNVHLRSHTGEKPFSCLKCGKSYTYKIALKTHRC